MQQLIIGAALLIAGLIINLIYGKMQQSGADTDVLDVRELSFRVKEGSAGVFTVQAPLQADHPEASPIGDKLNAYFETRILALEDDGRQREIYSMRSNEFPYLQDASGEEKLWVDIPSFGDAAELFPSHMETVEQGTPEAEKVQKLTDYQPGTGFQGYRLLEGCIQPGQPVALCGKVERSSGRLTVTGGALKNSFFTYHEPEQKAQQTTTLQNKIMMAVAAVAVIAGLILLLLKLLG